ncbi:D-alanyl-D-alanine carboxypeptidase family protein [Clostridium sardiniense]|uniref:D-alanyl-D-alanine carboxypeptidase family protein n=1 Tax=Clostridium sardiniense TaxID=29369 RepID=UPI00195E2302|nr:D-alanyl-D-alanine carboxypeptidase family protein [Clostridium sardiniense]MBM7836153.1 D-alanyl-D-alanine carboxypeptidase [Clostridium sardiniense]
MSKKFKSVVKFLFFIPIFYSLILTSANAQEAPPELNAESAILIDSKTGQVLYSKNDDVKHFPASTTKVLTALVVLENSKLSDIVTVGANPPFAKGSSIGLKEGEKFSVETLLTGLLLESGNDCAEALAEHVGGSIDGFAKMMNKKAKSIGCKNSNFENPSGLPDDKHVTTAYDLALIMNEAIKNPDYIRISKLLSVELPPSNLDGAKRWANNHNYLINPNSKYYYPNALVGKSGYTDVARHTFTISGQKDDQVLVATFLKAEDKDANYKDMANLLEYGFNNFKEHKLYSKDQEIDDIKVTDDINIPIVIDNDVFFTAEKSNLDGINPTLDYKLPRMIKKKSLKKGDVITTAKVIVNGKAVSEVNLLSGIDREYSFKIAISEMITNNLFNIIGISLVILIILIIIRIIIVRNRRKKRAFYNKLKRIKKKKNIY